jgi:hypothetical protein
MHHVASVRDTMQYTLSDISVKARRLLIDIDQPVFLAGNDDDRHFQMGVILLRRKRVGNHESCLRSTGADLAWPKSHLFRKAVELPRNWRRSKYLPHKEWAHEPRQNGRDGMAQDVTDQFSNPSVYSARGSFCSLAGLAYGRRYLRTNRGQHRQATRAMEARRTSSQNPTRYSFDFA